jgi:hypothetical protein
MEIRLLVGLEQLVDRAEAVTAALRGLSITEPLQLPEVPLPLSLESVESWLMTVEECRRKPRLARSKQLLEAHGIDTASIPAVVLESFDAIASLLQKIDDFPIALQSASLSAVGRALTKDIADAASVVEQFCEAVDAIGGLEGQAVEYRWVYELAVKSVADNPVNGTEIHQQAEEILQHALAAGRCGVIVDSFETLEAALAALSTFNDALAERNTLFAVEELSPDNDDLGNHNVQTATEILHQTVQRLSSEKQSLIQQVKGLLSELESVGSTFDVEATTVAELRARVPELRAALDKRRRRLRESLGKDVYEIVEVLAKGDVPTRTQVGDTKLGAALRKAVKSGYRVRLEVPHED